MKRFVPIILIFFISFFNKMLGQNDPILTFDPHGHSFKISNILFSPDGNRLYSCSEDKTIRVWDVQSGQLLRTLRTAVDNELGGRFWAMALSPDGNYLAAGGYSALKNDSVFTTISIINTKTFEQDGTFGGVFATLADVDFSADGKYLIASGGNLYFWNFEEAKKNFLRSDEIILTKNQLSVGNKQIEKFSLSADTKVLAATDSDSTLIILNFTNGLESAIDSNLHGLTYNEILKDSNHIEEIEFSKNGKYFAAVGKSKIIRLFDSAGKLVNRIDSVAYMPFTMSFSEDSEKLVVAGYHGIHCFVYSIPDGLKLREFNEHQNSIHAAQFFGNDTVATAGGFSGDIIIWKVSTNKEIKRFTSNGSSVYSAAFGNGLQIAFGTLMLAPSDVRITENPPHYAELPYYVPLEKKFDLERLDLKEFNSEIDTNFIRINLNYDTLKLKKDGPFKVDIGNGKEIINKNDWVRCYSFAPEGNIIVGNEYSLKMCDNEGTLLRNYIGQGVIWAVSISEDGKYMVTSSGDQTIKIWSLLDKGIFPSVLDKFIHPSWKELFEFEGILNFANAKSREGWLNTIEYLRKTGDSTNAKILDESLKYAAPDILPLATLFAAKDNEWVIWTPKGFFASSANGEKYFGWIINRGMTHLADFYSAGQLFDKFYRPDLVREVLKTCQQDTIVAEQMGIQKFDIKELISGVPKTSFAHVISRFFNSDVKIEKGNFVDESELTLELSIIDTGGGIDNVFLYQNNKLIGTLRDTLIEKEKNLNTLNIKFPVTLIPGRNSFKVSTFNSLKTEAPPQYLLLNYETYADPDYDLYILGVGINNYRNKKFNLNFAAQDAESFVKVIETQGDKIYGSIFPYFLSNEEATKENIAEIMDKIAYSAEPEDVFVFYYAGHGVMYKKNYNDNPEYFIIPNDVTQIYGNDDSLRTKAISSSDLLLYSQNIRAQKQLLVIDACHSGGALTEFQSRGFAEEKAIYQLSRSTGTIILAASGLDEVAREDSSLGHGIYTYCVLEGLEGSADTNPKDKKVTVGELAEYLSLQVNQLSKKLKNQEQYPKRFMSGDSFPIVITK